MSVAISVLAATADPAATAEVEWLIDLTRSLRTARFAAGLRPGPFAVRGCAGLNPSLT